MTPPPNPSPEPAPPAPRQAAEPPEASQASQASQNTPPALDGSRKARRPSRSLHDALQEGIARDAQMHSTRPQQPGAPQPEVQVLAGAAQEPPAERREASARLAPSGASQGAQGLGSASHEVPLGVSDPRQAARTGSMEWIDVDVIDDNPYQPRLSMDETELRSLGASISQRGQLQPCLARPHPAHRGRFQLAVGHRRKEAVRRGARAGAGRADEAQRAGQLMCVVRDLDDEAMLDAAFAENEERSDFSVFDRAHYFKHKQRMASQKLNPGSRKLLSFEALTQHENLAISPRMIRLIVEALQLPSDVRAELAGVDLSAARPGGSGAPGALRPNEKHCRALLMLQSTRSPQSPTPEQKALLQAIKSERLSGNEALRRAEAFKRAQSPPTSPNPPAGKHSALANAPQSRGLSTDASPQADSSGGLAAGTRDDGAGVGARSGRAHLLVRQANLLARQALAEIGAPISTDGAQAQAQDSLAQEVAALCHAAQQLSSQIEQIEPGGQS